MILKSILRNSMEVRGLDPSGSEKGPVVDCYEDGNETSSSIKCAKILG
jgi:hypothetical protein